ncbi:ureidoglycolate lyase [Ancylobacter novellus]|uniref:ureidoglycolate lyase n=1 Tax=Ancylobacter novellus TaxID=921 RepID=UPI001FCBE5E5|nr:ureidoglycolate lyase [Ancylobacter novellus]
MSELSKRDEVGAVDPAGAADGARAGSDARVPERDLALELQLVNEELFRPYGALVQPATLHPLRVNAGTALRHDVTSFDRDQRSSSRLIASVFETQPQALPLSIDLLERHPYSQQAIIEMSGADFVLAVCLPDGNGDPELGSLRAFLFPRGSGVIYHRGVWHTPIIGTGKTGRFFVQSWQDGTASDCLETAIARHLIYLSGQAGM